MNQHPQDNLVVALGSNDVSSESMSVASDVSVAARIPTVCTVITTVKVRVLGGAAATAHADGVPNHNHFLTTPGNGIVHKSAHTLCDNPDILHDAFHNFHEDVHTGAPTPVGGIVIDRTLC
jgi:hypothetical protein